MVYDIAFCCWRNDTSEVSIPEDAVINHIVRMKLNPKHCKEALGVADDDAD